MAKKGKKPRAPKKNAGYKLPPPIPPGEIIHDGNKNWKIGPSIGVGGFGEIYSACEYREGETPPIDASGYPYVIKIEPMENGPLFVETHFYNRNYKKDLILEFMESRKLSQLGMPTYISSGSFKLRNEELRFLIMERYGTDLWKTFKKVGRKFPTPTVFQLGLQMLDVLDYVHSRSYIHADIKGANILLGIKEGTENQAYLLDFGLAYKIVGENYKPDPKSEHEGTIEYTSTDRHVGAKTMRGDLEILGYNLLQWLVGELPWENVIEDPKKVHQKKTDFMSNVRTWITTNYPNVPDELVKFFEYIKTLEQKDVPNYTICRSIFESYLTSVGKTRSSLMEFPLTNDNEQPKISHNLALSEEWAEMDNENILQDNREVEDESYDKKKSFKELNMPIAKKIIEFEIQSKKFDENQAQEVIKSKKKKKNLEIPLVQNEAKSEQPDDSQQPEVTKTKKRDKNLNDHLAEKQAECVQPDDETCQEVIKTKKKNKNIEELSAENDAESLQPDFNKEQDFTKTKKKKRNKNIVPALAENEVESEQPDDNQQHEVRKRKKKYLYTGDSLAENDIESEQPDDNQQSKVTKTKKKKKDMYNVDPLAESDFESDQPDDMYQPEVTKTKRKKKDKNIAHDLAENEAESEQPKDNQREVTKTKKKKKDRNLEDLLEKTKPESEQINEKQQHEVRKSKKKKKDMCTGDPLAENDIESEQSDDNQQVEVTKTKKKKKDKYLEDPLTDNEAESEQPDDYQRQEVTEIMKKKTKKHKKITVAKDAETELPDDNLEELPKKKRKSSELHTPKKKIAKKPKAKDYLENESESEDYDETQQKKKKRTYFEPPLFKEHLPLIKVDADTEASPKRRGLRSNGKTNRTFYANLE